MLTNPWPMSVGALLLREAREGDVEAMLAVRNDPGVNRFMIHTRAEPEDFRRQWLAVPTSESDFSCVAELDGQVVAMGFLELEDGTGQPGMPQLTQAGIGYVVDPAFAGRGVASDLARGLLTAAFDHLGLRRVTAGCNADNPASARVLEKAGMRREQHGVADSWHTDLGWVDGYEYAILAREWRGRDLARDTGSPVRHAVRPGVAGAARDPSPTRRCPVSVSQDVVVVGGGVIGLGCAWRLARAGASVTVLDPEPGAGASWAAGGMLAPISEAVDFSEPLLRLNMASALLYPDFVAELEEASGLSVDYRRFGTLIMGRFPDDVPPLHALADFAEGLGLDVERLDAGRCRELEPRLHPDVAAGLHVPGDHAVDNRRLHAALLVACERAGVRVLRRWVTRLDVRDGVARGVEVDGGPDGTSHLEAGTVVLASGSTAAALPGLPEAARPPVRGVKGEILRLQVPEHLRPFLSRCVRGAVHGVDVYLVPRTDGQLVIGATAEERDDREATAAGVHQLLHAAMEMVPVIGELPFGEVFAALRPGSPDNGPMLGTTDVPGLVLATGHHRNGVLLTPVTADAIAAVVTGGQVPAEVAAFAPGRFATDAA